MRGTNRLSRKRDGYAPRWRCGRLRANVCAQVQVQPHTLQAGSSRRSGRLNLLLNRLKIGNEKFEALVGRLFLSGSFRKEQVAPDGHLTRAMSVDLHPLADNVLYSLGGKDPGISL